MNDKVVYTTRASFDRNYRQRCSRQEWSLSIIDKGHESKLIKNEFLLKIINIKDTCFIYQSNMSISSFMLVKIMINVSF